MTFLCVNDDERRVQRERERKRKKEKEKMNDE